MLTHHTWHFSWWKVLKPTAQSQQLIGSGQSGGRFLCWVCGSHKLAAYQPIRKEYGLLLCFYYLVSSSFIRFWITQSNQVMKETLVLFSSYFIDTLSTTTCDFSTALSPSTIIMAAFTSYLHMWLSRWQLTGLDIFLNLLKALYVLPWSFSVRNQNYFHF